MRISNALPIDEFSQDLREALRNTPIDRKHDHLNAGMDGQPKARPNRSKPVVTRVGLAG